MTAALGVLAAPAVSWAQADLTVSTNSLTFVDTRAGAGPTIMSFDVTNSGTSGITITPGDITVTSGSPPFTLADNLGGTNLMPGESAQVDVEFSPTAAGSFTGVITVDDGVSPEMVDVFGDGVIAEISVTGNGDFGQVVVLQPTPRMFTIANLGEFPLTLNSISLANQTPNGQFSIAVAPPGGTLVSMGSPVTVTVSCSPTTVGTKTANLVINSDTDVGTNPRVVPLTCQGIVGDISVTPNPLDFGSRNVGSTTMQPVTISNATGAGVGPLTITGFTLSGSSSFSLTNPGQIVLDPGDSVQIPVTFNPTLAGLYSANLAIASNDPDENPVNVTLSGVGLDPPSLILSTTAINFGNVPTTSMSQMTFTIANASGAFRRPLDVSNIQIVAGGGDYSVSPNSAPGIQPGNSITVTVTFSPQATGTRNGTVRITSNDAGSPHMVSLAGVGTAPNIAVSPLTINFGNVGLTQSSPPTAVTAMNNGNQNLQISGVMLSNSADFSFSGPNMDTVAPGGMTSWNLVCTPQSTGLRTGTFSISSNDPDQPTTVVNLSCTGIDAILTIDPAASFPDTYINTQANPRVIDLVNNQTANPITITQLTVSPGVFTLQNPPALPFTINGNQRQPVTLRFAPLANQNYAGTLAVMTDQGAFNFAVTGNGVQAILALETEPIVLPLNPLNFGSVRAGTESDPQTILVRNVGTAPYRIFSVTAGDAMNFQITGPGGLPATVSPGGQRSFTVRATPQMVGQLTTAVTVQTDIPEGMVSQFMAQTVGTSSEIALSRNVLDYGGIDVQMGLIATEVATITNTGTDTLNIGNLVLSGAGEFTLPAGQPTTATVPPGDTFDVVVEYRPMVEAEHTGTLQVISDAFTLPMAVVQLSGQGADRHIEVSDLTVEFPETYRNPKEPSRQTIEVANTGGATLVLQAVMTYGADARTFAVADSAPMIVPPGGTEDVVVEFSPDASAAFDATLSIMNDDNDRPMVEVILSGRGVTPNVAFSRERLQITSGVNVPARLSDLPAEQQPHLQIINMQAADSFEVREFRIVDELGNPMTDGPFRVVDFEPGTEIDANGMLGVDIEFTPEQAGTFTATVEVFLDIDPLRVAAVTIEGTAIDVELSGGGCACDVPGAGAWHRGGTAPWAALLFGILVLAARRRRRAVAARPGARRASLLAGPVVAAVFFCRPRR